MNSSLVLVDYANRQRREGIELFKRSSTHASLQTDSLNFGYNSFVGLIPLMTTVTPATGPFLPIAISLAWGVLFATFITLLLVPCLYLMVEDWLDFIASLKAWLLNDPTLKRAID